MTKTKVVVAAALALAALAATDAVARASSPTEAQLERCVQSTHPGLREKPIVTAIGALSISADQKIELLGRLATYGSSDYLGIRGLGLSAAAMNTINALIKAQVAAQPELGAPCPRFTDETKAMQWLRATLLGNGFHSAGLQIIAVTDRQVQYQGNKDGNDAWGVMVKTGTMSVRVVVSEFPDGGGGAVSTASDLTTPFEV